MKKNWRKTVESFGSHKIEAGCILVSNRYSMYYLLFIIPVTNFFLLFYSLISYIGNYDLQSTVMDHLLLQHLKCCDLNMLLRHAGIVSVSSYFTLPVD